MDDMQADRVETTLGPLPVEDLGWVDAHEHVIIDGGFTIVKDPDLRLDEVDKAIEEVGRWKRAGGGAIVDTMPLGCGRNVDKLVAVSEATGVPIVVPTGFHKSVYYLPDHWQHRYDEETISELLATECTEGVDRNGYDGPIVERSNIKAGLIKLAGDYQTIGKTMQKLIRAAGSVHQATDIPVLVHTEMGTVAEEFLDLLEEAGVPPWRVLLSHVDRNPDFKIHLRLVQRGAFLQYDTPGRTKYHPDHVVIGLMRQLFDAGYGENLLLGGDRARRSYWKAYGGGPGLDYLLTVFTKRLLEEGFSNEEVATIWKETPLRWLSSKSANT